MGCTLLSVQFPKFLLCCLGSAYSCAAQRWAQALCQSYTDITGSLSPILSFLGLPPYFPAPRSSFSQSSGKNDGIFLGSASPLYCHHAVPPEQNVSWGKQSSERKEEIIGIPPSHVELPSSRRGEKGKNEVKKTRNLPVASVHMVFSLARNTGFLLLLPLPPLCSSVIGDPLGQIRDSKKEIKMGILAQMDHFLQVLTLLPNRPAVVSKP